MKEKILLLLVIVCNYLYGQRIDIDEIEGVWVVEDFYKSFVKTKSILKSKEAFDFGFPVGLRFNKSEIKEEIWNVGYSFLHDHFLHSEVSDYIVVNKDTIREQGRFKMNLNSNKKLFHLEPLKDSGAYFHNAKLSFKKGSITLLIKGFLKGREKVKVKYVKISSKFNEAYQYPNPLYYFTRKVVLSGDYILKDSLDNIIAKKITIKSSGKIVGAKRLKNNYIHYSTDVYCGPPTIDEIVFICENSNVKNLNCGVYVLKKKNDSSIILYKDYARDIWDTKRKLKNKMYKLIKINSEL